MKTLLVITEEDRKSILGMHNLSEQTNPSSGLFRVGDKLQVDWMNDKYPCQIFLTVKRAIDQHNMECVVTKVDGPIIDLKPGMTVKVTVKNGKYNLNFEENLQNIEGPVKDKYFGIKKINSNDLSEQTQPAPTQSSNQYKFPIDVVLSDGSMISPNKIKIPRGTIMSWNGQTKVGTLKVGGTTITLEQTKNGEGTMDSYTMVFNVGGKDYYMSWADPIFGVVYNKQFQDIAEQLFQFLNS
jgi:hypothetical protein